MRKIICTMVWGRAMKGRDGNLMLGDDLEMKGQNREMLMKTRELQGF